MATSTLIPRRSTPVDPARRRLGGAPGSRRTRAGMVLVFAAAVVVAVLAAGELAAVLRARSAPLATDTVTLSGLTLHVNSVNWVPFDSNDPALQDPTAAGGYQMPAQMMPDMPAEGEARLNLDITLTDAGGQARALNTRAEFHLGGGAGDQSRTLEGDTFGDLGRINPGNAVDGNLFFDLKPPSRNDPPLYLEWRRGGDTARVLLVPGGHASTHTHH